MRGVLALVVVLAAACCCFSVVTATTPVVTATNCFTCMIARETLRRGHTLDCGVKGEFTKYMQKRTASYPVDKLNKNCADILNEVDSDWKKVNDDAGRTMSAERYCINAKWCDLTAKSLPDADTSSPLKDWQTRTQERTVHLQELLAKAVPYKKEKNAADWDSTAKHALGSPMLHVAAAFGCGLADIYAGSDAMKPSWGLDPDVTTNQANYKQWVRMHADEFDCDGGRMVTSQSRYQKETHGMMCSGDHDAVEGHNDRDATTLWKTGSTDTLANAQVVRVPSYEAVHKVLYTTNSQSDKGRTLGSERPLYGALSWWPGVFHVGAPELESQYGSCVLHLKRKFNAAVSLTNRDARKLGCIKRATGNHDTKQWDCIGTLQSYKDNPRNAWNKDCVDPMSVNNRYTRVPNPPSPGKLTTAKVTINHVDFKAQIHWPITVNKLAKQGGVGVTECFVHSKVPLKPEAIAYVSGNFVQDFAHVLVNDEHPAASLYAMSAAHQIPIRWIWTGDWNDNDKANAARVLNPYHGQPIKNYQQRFSVEIVCNTKSLDTDPTKPDLKGNGCDNDNVALQQATDLVRAVRGKWDAVAQTNSPDYSEFRKAFALLIDKPAKTLSALAVQLKLEEPPTPKKLKVKTKKGYTLLQDNY